MVWDIAIQRRLMNGGHEFKLDVVMRSDARRLVLFGSSGAGKTMTLKAVAGLLRPDHGHIRLNGQSLYDSSQNIDLPPQQRSLAYLFQEYALFPHLTVIQNLAFGLKRGWANPGKNFDHPAVQRWLKAFELEPLAKRHPHELSGGQRQRVALGRALVSEPRAILLDEPFAALDAQLRQKLRVELTELQRGLAIPMVLITHDPADVDVFADEVIHIDAGRVAHRPSRRAVG
ncbi:MAG: ATP-binding cassette domain-containing protein [Pseudomonadota bacterium]